MARYIGPTERISRRAGVNLFLKGERSNSPKNALTKRPYPPGQQGPNKRQGKPSDYGKQLREKQNTKAIYGILEKQFRNYYRKAAKSKEATGEKLLQLLETRLDNIIYRLGFADSRRQARQYVTHGHVAVEGKKINIPSYSVKPKQTIQLKLERKLSSSDIPTWVDRDEKKLSGELLSIPNRDQIPVEVNEQLVVEFYSR